MSIVNNERGGFGGHLIFEGLVDGLEAPESRGEVYAPPDGGTVVHRVPFLVNLLLLPTGAVPQVPVSPFTRKYALYYSPTSVFFFFFKSFWKIETAKLFCKVFLDH